MSKGGKCEICGYDKNLAALDFHHLDPNQKDFEIDAILRTSSGKWGAIEIKLGAGYKKNRNF